MMHKKGALELSINAIVIIVIALTLLGLGIVFVRNMFEDITGISESTFQKISEELNTKLKTGDEVMAFSKSELSLERGKSSLEAFGLKNSGDKTIQFGIKLKAVNCPQNPQGDPTGVPCPPIETWFDYKQGPAKYTVPAADSTIAKVIVSPKSGSNTGRYLIEMTAYRGAFDSATGLCENYVEATESTAESGCLVLGQTDLFLSVN